MHHWFSLLWISCQCRKIATSQQNGQQECPSINIVRVKFAYQKRQLVWTMLASKFHQMQHLKHCWRKHELLYTEQAHHYKVDWRLGQRLEKMHTVSASKLLQRIRIYYLLNTKMFQEDILMKQIIPKQLPSSYWSLECL